jgi:hypothetical protein
MYPVIRNGQPETRRVHSDLHRPGIIFGSIEHENLAVPDHRSGIESVQRLPMNLPCI